MTYPKASEDEHSAVLVHPKYRAAEPKALRAYRLTRDNEFRKAERIANRAHLQYSTALQTAADIRANATIKAHEASERVKRAAYAEALRIIRAKHQS